jgi:hypothetical protein
MKKAYGIKQENPPEGAVLMGSVAGIVIIKDTTTH